MRGPSGTVTEHCEGRDHESDVAPKRGLVLMARHRFDQMRTAFFYFFSLLLLLSSVVRAQEIPNPLEETQKAKSAEAVPPVLQVTPAQRPGLQEEHPRLFWIIPTRSPIARRQYR